MIKKDEEKDLKSNSEIKPGSLVETYRELIDILPLKTIDYAFAYGSCKYF